MKNNPIIKSHGFLMFSDVSPVSASLSSLQIADFRGFVRAVAPQKRGMASRPLQASARSSLSGPCRLVQLRSKKWWKTWSGSTKVQTIETLQVSENRRPHSFHGFSDGFLHLNSHLQVTPAVIKPWKIHHWWRIFLATSTSMLLRRHLPGCRVFIFPGYRMVHPVMFKLVALLD